jgi:hypothetical protein
MCLALVACERKTSTERHPTIAACFNRFHSSVIDRLLDRERPEADSVEMHGITVEFDVRTPELNASQLENLAARLKGNGELAIERSGSGWIIHVAKPSTVFQSARSLNSELRRQCDAAGKLNSALTSWRFLPMNLRMDDGFIRDDVNLEVP